MSDFPKILSTKQSLKSEKYSLSQLHRDRIRNLLFDLLECKILNSLSLNRQKLNLKKGYLK
jgi:hypothetical protein